MVAVQGESRKFLDRINMIDRIMDNGHGLNPVNPVNPVQKQKMEGAETMQTDAKKILFLCHENKKCCSWNRRRRVRLRATRCGEI